MKDKDNYLAIMMASESITNRQYVIGGEQKVIKFMGTMKNLKQKLAKVWLRFHRFELIKWDYNLIPWNHN